MSPALTRRGLVQLAGGAIGGTVAGIPMSARAAAVASDSTLLALIARHAAVVAERDAFQDHLEAVEAQFKAAAPPRPEKLTETIHDVVNSICSTGRDSRPNSRPWPYFTSSDVARLRTQSPMTLRDWDDEGHPRTSLPNPHGEARRQEILNAYDGWEDEKQALADRIGLTAATVEDDRLYEIVWDLRDAIRDTTPTTLAGLNAKARWTMGLDDAEEEEKQIVADLAASGGAAS